MWVTISSPSLALLSDRDWDDFLEELDRAAESAGALRFRWANMSGDSVDGNIECLWPLTEARLARFEAFARRHTPDLLFQYARDENEAHSA